MLEKKVLLIDADPQANATSGLGIDVESVEVGTYQLLEHTNKAEDAIVKTSSPNLDLIPAHIDLVAIEIELVDKLTSQGGYAKTPWCGEEGCEETVKEKITYA